MSIHVRTAEEEDLESFMDFVIESWHLDPMWQALFPSEETGMFSENRSAMRVWYHHNLRLQLDGEIMMLLAIEEDRLDPRRGQVVGFSCWEKGIDPREPPRYVPLWLVSFIDRAVDRICAPIVHNLYRQCVAGTDYSKVALLHLDFATPGLQCNTTPAMIQEMQRRWRGRRCVLITANKTLVQVLTALDYSVTASQEVTGLSTSFEIFAVQEKN